VGRSILTKPSEEPITLAEAKTHLRESGTDQDQLIEALIVTAREQAETHTGRAFCTQSWTLKLDAFPCERFIRIPYPPLISVQSVKYYDSDGVLQTMSTSDYVVDTTSHIGKIDLAYEAEWPTPRTMPNAVVIAFTCGYGGRENVPSSIKAAMLLNLSHLYENREATISGTIITPLPMAYDSLLSSYRVWEEA
jgi:uncharacterized phiE125 gp8 family phage protein